MSARILLLRSGSVGSENALPGDVTVLYTHTVVPRSEGVAEALAFDAYGATLVISSKETVNYLLPLFRAPFAQMVAVGEGTGDLLRRLNAGGSGDSLRKVNGLGTGDLLGRVNTGGRLDDTSGGASTNSGARGAGSLEKTANAPPPVIVPEVPGAAGVIRLLRESSSAAGMRMLWPHGSDTAPEPLEQVRALGVQLVSPVVYEKRPLSPSELNPSILADFRAGRFGAVAVGSTAGHDALLAALGRPAALPSNLRWGVLGPETAKAVAARGLPTPSIPAHPLLFDLLELLRKETR